MESKNSRCPECEKNTLIETYESYECLSCSHFIFKQASFSKVLEGNEIAKIITETIHEHGITDPTEIKAIEEAFLNENSSSVVTYQDIFEHSPIDMHEMVHSERYLGKITESLYPKLKEEIIFLFENPNITTVLLMGSLGWGKTYYLATAFIATIMKLCFLRSPQTFYNLDENTPLSMFNFCVTDSQARKTMFTYLLNFFDAVPWFKQYAPRNEDKTLEIEIKSKNIVLRCGGPTPGSVIGTNLHSFAGDEMNFMQVIQDSKRSRDGEEYDQAKIVTDVFTNRQKSRFTQNFIYCPPRRYLCSSEQFPDDFLPSFLKEKEALGNLVTKEQVISKDFDPDKQNTYVLCYSNWETKPQKFFPGWTFEKDANGDFKLDKNQKRIWKNFKVGIGHSKKGDRILLDSESEKGYKEILKVPIFFRKEFEGGIAKLYGSIRDIAGKATLYNNPWFNPSHLIQCIDTTRENPCNYVNPSLEERNFHLDVSKMMENGSFVNPDAPRYVHLDLSKTDDHTGICIVHISKIVPIMKKIAGEVILEHLPFFHVDLMLRIKPPGNGKSIDYSKIRNVLYLLRRKGMNYNLITYDKVEGEMGTHFEKNDIKHDYLSLDKNIQPWFHLEMVLREKRVSFYDYEPIKEELPFLFYDEKKNKIDHRKNKKKDMSDAFAGAIWNASQSGNLRLKGDMLVDLMAFEERLPGQEDPFKKAGVGNFYGKGMAYVEES